MVTDIFEFLLRCTLMSVTQRTPGPKIGFQTWPDGQGLGLRRQAAELAGTLGVLSEAYGNLQM